MKATNIIISCVGIVIFLPILSFSQGWRGIVPLKSTCEDVKRALGNAKCESSTYYLEDAVVDIGFSQKPCHEKWPYERWNVLPHTVTAISVRPKKQIRVTDLGVDITNFKKTKDEYSPEGSIYYSEKEGMIITVDAEGKALRVNYLPAAKDHYLHCPGSSEDWKNIGKRQREGLVKSDEYSEIDFREEKKHLNKFAQQYSHYVQDAQVYIIAYGGRRTHVGEAQARAERAKNYLITNCNIEAKRILTLDGGYREESTVELWFGTRSDGAPSIGPTVHPSEVQIVNDGNGKTNDRRLPRQRHEQHRPCQ